MEIAPVDWLERDKHTIEGLDHLGVEVVSANLYAALLPGITNVTDRARYYSFYPWIIHRYAQRPGAAFQRTDWLGWFRRLEFAYAAACAAWEEDAAGTPATAVVGVDAARRLLHTDRPGASVNLSLPADLDGAGKVPKGAYFKNPEGGFAQYYKVPLTILGLLQEDPNHRNPDRCLTTYAGVPVAESVHVQSGFKELLGLAGDDRVRVPTLATLGRRINPSSIDPGGREEALLRSLFLADGDELCRGQMAHTRLHRRASLMLGLRYIRDCETLHGEFPWEFRWACSESALPTGAPWELPGALAETALAWAAYHKNDIMNYCLECLFWLALHRIDDGLFTPREVARHVAELARQHIDSGVTRGRAQTIGPLVSDLVSACERETSEATAEPWGVRSTRSWVKQLERSVDSEKMSNVAALAFRVLGRLIAELQAMPTRPRAAMLRSLEPVGRSYEVHLIGLAERAKRWAGERLAKFVEDLVLEWVLYRHLRVATRKLAGQGVSTFKFRPEQGILLLVTDKIPLPTFTNPRLRQAHRILADLHLVSVTDHESTDITPAGLAALDAGG